MPRCGAVGALLDQARVRRPEHDEVLEQGDEATAFSLGAAASGAMLPSKRDRRLMSMFTRSKVLMRLSPVALIPALLLWTMQPGVAVITQQERDACSFSHGICQNKCGDTSMECGPVGSKDYNTCVSDCNGKCDIRKENCLDDADKDRRTVIQPTPGIQNAPLTSD